MGPVTVPAPMIESLTELPRLLESVEGFAAVLESLRAGHSATIDGVWGSAGALVAAALERHAPRTLALVIAHPGDIDRWADELATFIGIRPEIFPAWGSPPDTDEAWDEVANQRLGMLLRLGGDDVPRVLLTTIQALLQPVPERSALAERRRQLRIGQEEPPDRLASWLVEHGFRRAEAVELPGQFSRRGGLLDVFSPGTEAPLRVEFFGDEIESIRQFSSQSQRSLRSLPTVDLIAPSAPTPVDSTSDLERGHLCDYLPPDAWTAAVEAQELHEQGRHYHERSVDARGLFTVEGVYRRLLNFPSAQITALPSGSVETVCHLRVESVERFSGEVTKIRDELDTVAAAERVLIACHNEAECRRLVEVFSGGRLAASGRLRVTAGRVQAGFRMVDQGIVVLGETDLFHRDGTSQAAPRRRVESRALDSFLDLAEGDLIVHVSQGIARYRGMQILEKNRQAEEHLILEFREGTRVYVPASKIDLVQKYVGGSRTEPELSRLGGTSWQRKKQRVEEAVVDLASEMVELQALREARPGFPSPPDSGWQREFEAAFPYRETPDQLTAAAEIKGDMERPRPMDRLVCGDVGYGKTEVAMRAAFKTVDNGKQVAVLVPTTVLAEQHFRTFSQRFGDYPFVIEGISRFRSQAEQKRIVNNLARGGVDVIIGTHRLVSSDVRFHDLGLVVIDEEQRFGVEHKERLKRLRETVDVLTMTATPIPRTLHLALLGIRDISNLETPPADRLAIETRIARFDPQLIRHAIVRELNREGQVYFVHNRVHNIHEIAGRLADIVPEARITVAHGQMGEHELERAMLSFVRRENDVLVATTIIESGLDIPNVNTIFINQADQYGLADLHQLRGRVGRYKHRAYAYLLLDSGRGVTPTAARRLKAIEEFTELGAGFKIAMRDLEIRGAGNILGTQQSGHIAAVGYEMYCQLLEKAVRQLKNQPLRTPLEVNIDLPWPAYLPRDYVAGQRQRIEVYRRLARVRRRERLDDFRQEIRDRFGPLPPSAEWLLRLAEVRLLAARWQITGVHLEEVLDKSAGPRDLVLSYRSPRKMKSLADRAGRRLRIVDEATAYLRLAPAETEPEPLYACLKELLRSPAEPV